MLDFPTLESEAKTTGTAVAPAAATAIDLQKVDLTDVALAQFGPWRDSVADVKTKLSALVLDLSTPSKVAEARTLRHRLIGEPLAGARKVSQGLKSKLTSVSKAIGSELELIEAGYADAATLITPLIEAREAELAEEKRKREAAEAARVAGHRERLATLAGYVEHAKGLPAARIALGIEKVKAIEIDRAAWEEFADQAVQQKEVTLLQLEKMHGEAVAEEARQAEAARVAAEQEAERQRLAAVAADLERQRLELEAARAAAALAPAPEIVKAAPAADSAAATSPAATLGNGVTPEPRQLEAPPHFEAQASQQVLKAEPATAEATDRDAPAMASPGVGSMGAGQPADAGPAAGADVPMLKLGELWDLLGLTDRETFLAGIGFPATPAPKGTGKLYRASDLDAIYRAAAKHFLKLAGLAAPEAEQQAA